MITTMLNQIIMLDVNEFMVSSGKINVVIGVMLIIFIGLIIYLFSIDKKVKKIEDKLNNKN